MTVSSTNTIARASANGTDTEFLFDFLLLDDEDLQVKVSDVAVDPSSYTVTIDTEGEGGSVAFDTAPTAGSLVEISRVLAIVQQTEYPVAGPFPAKTHERALDRLTMVCQQLDAAILAGTSAFSWRGSWATATSYDVRALVEGPDGNWYYCSGSHLSEVFANDLASGLWVLLINRASLLEAVADAEAAEAASEASALSAQIAQAAAEAAAENIVEAWEDSPTSYDYPDIVAGSNGFTYRCVGTAVVGVDPTTDDGTYWVNISSASSLVATMIVNANATAVKNYLHILSADCTLTLPLAPSDADSLSVANFSGVKTCVVARNGSKINGLEEDLTIDVLHATMQFFYSGSTYGWVTL